MATSALAFADGHDFQDRQEFKAFKDFRELDDVRAAALEGTHIAADAPKRTHTRRPAPKPPARPTTGRQPDRAEIARLFGSDQLDDLRRMALRLGGGTIEADDLLHDALERALANFDRFELGTNLHAWMRTIMYRLVVDKSRSRRRRKARLELARSVAPRATPAADEIEPPPPWADLDLADVCAATAGLSAPLKDTFLLFAVEGLSYDQIAERLGILPRTVGTRLLRAKLKLRTVLAERACGASAPAVSPMSLVAHTGTSCSPNTQLAA
jgi:RNA polymerase sigma-70 factor (ECF subfamily)